MIFFYILYALAGLYCLFLLFLIIGTFRINRTISSERKNHFISVVVAARNEDKHLSALLNDLLQQEYPQDKSEIIIVNDRSTDKTDYILNNFSQKYPQIKYINITDELPELIGKKRALTEGINHAQGEVLLFTDADCRPGKLWLSAMNEVFSRGFDVVVGYSPLKCKNKSFGRRIISILKRLERLAMFTFSAGSIGWNWGITATGRNFAYKKKVFESINGFDGIGHIPSGDDDLFLQKISKSHSFKIGFATHLESYVPSIEEKSHSQTFQQEKRRGSKWRYYPALIKCVSLVAFIFLLLILITFIFALTGVVTWNFFLIVFLAKSFFDLLILLRGAMIFREYISLLVFPFVEVLYAPYFVIFGLLGTFGKYKWKM
ncbi:MAG: glycosyltransferase [Candidatus Cloacimonetes bacterium]|nr:glycosyltransferase [Candidatus Cloacimonadota bacterium]